VAERFAGFAKAKPPVDSIEAAAPVLRKSRLVN
jgi:hypothetical protein